MRNGRFYPIKVIVGIALLFIVGGFSGVRAASTNSVVNPAGGCSKQAVKMQSRMHIPCQEWRVWFATDGTWIGGDFNSGNTDYQLTSPAKGRFDDLSGEHWAGSEEWMQRTVTNAGTYHIHRGDARHDSQRSMAPWSPSLAAQFYKTGNSGNWTIIHGQASTGWVFHSDTAMQIYVPHGKVQVGQNDYVYAGNWTQAVTDATGYTGTWLKH